MDKGGPGRGRAALDRPIGVLAATPEELAPLLSHFTAGEAPGPATAGCGADFYCGRLGGRRAVLVRTGVGKACAAMAAQRLIDAFDPSLLVNFGGAGGIGGGMNIGDVLLADAVVDGDAGYVIRGRSFKGLCHIHCGGRSQRVRCLRLTGAAFDLASDHLRRAGVPLHRGTLVTTDSFIMCSRARRNLASRFGALGVDMEGAALAQVALSNDRPLLVLKGISDRADNLVGFEANWAAIAADQFAVTPEPPETSAFGISLSRTAARLADLVLTLIEALPAF